MRRGWPKPAGYHWDALIPVVRADGQRPCRWCKGPVPKPKRNWCGDPKCVDAWRFRTDPAFFRATVAREKGTTCAHCGLDTAPLDPCFLIQQLLLTTDATRVDPAWRTWTERPETDRAGLLYPLSHWTGLLLDAMAWRASANVPAREPAWQVDHIIPVADGGPYFDMDNLQVLCAPCHRIKSSLENVSRSAQKVGKSEVKPHRKPFPVKRRRSS